MENFVSTSSHVCHNTLITTNGDYLRVWKLKGNHCNEIDLESDIVRHHLNQLDTYLRNIAPTDIAVWTHNIRYQIFDKSHTVFDSEFCRLIHKNASSNDPRVTNELYLTLIYRPPIPNLGTHCQDEVWEKLEELSCQIERSLENYELEEIGTYEDEHNIPCSKLLECLGFLIRGDWQKYQFVTDQKWQRSRYVS